jgi:zinc protease
MARGRVPLVSVRLVMDAGEATVPDDRAGIAVLAGDSLQGGTRHRSGAELAEALERLGSALRVSTGWDATTVAFTCMAERLDEMLGLLAEVVREPSFPAEEVERMRRQRLATIRQRRMEPDELADDELDREIFGAGHAYGRPISGTESSVGPLEPAEAGAFAADRYGPIRGGFTLVGDLSPDRASGLAQRHLGEWRPISDAGRPALPAVPPAAGRVVIVNRPGSVQSELRIGLPGPPRGHPEEIALRVANTVLGGAFTSRLNMSLRERHGLTYGARSTFGFRRGGGVFSISTAVQTEMTARALGEAMEVLRRFSEEGPSPEELERARDYLAGVFPLRMETTAQLAARLAELVIFDLPDDYHHRYRDEVRNVDVALAREAVHRHLPSERAAVVLVADAREVAEAVAGLGLGEPEIRDP